MTQADPNQASIQVWGDDESMARGMGDPPRGFRAVCVSDFILDQRVAEKSERAPPCSGSFPLLCV